MTINDEVFSALSQYTGTINNRLFAYLGDKGYTGTLNDRLNQIGGWSPPSPQDDGF